MDWDILHFIEEATIERQEEGVSLVCYAPEAANHFHKLLDGATQAALDFDGGVWEGKPVIGLRLRNANGEFYMALRKNNWGLLDEQPDEILFKYGSEEKNQFRTVFLNWMFEDFLEKVIEQYNDGDQSLFVTEIVSVFAEED